MFIYEVRRPEQGDYYENITPAKTLAYYTSKEAVERHIEDHPKATLEVYLVDVRAMYNPEDPEPISTLIYGGYTTMNGKYKRGWLDSPAEN